MANNSSGKNKKNTAKGASGKNTSKGAGSKNTKSTKKTGSRAVAGVVVMVLLAAIFCGSLLFEDKIDEALGLRKVEYYNTGDMVAIGSMNIHFIDVGQGDACLIELPDNKTVLIDAGENNSSVRSKLTEYIDDVNDNRRLLDRPEIKYFDYVIATHSDSDHIGSLEHILKSYHAATFYRPNEKVTYSGYTDPALSGELARNRFRPEGHGEKETETYKKAIAAGYAPHDNFIEGIVTNPFDDTQNCIKPTFDGEEYQSGGDFYYELNFYGPIKPVYTGKDNHNNYSPIIIAEYQGRRIALSGDSADNGEKDFAAFVSSSATGDRFYPLKSSAFYADIIKLGHHGSNTSSTDEYLAIMTSAAQIQNIYIVISVNTQAAAKKGWEHPHSEVLARLKALRIPDGNILKTDACGDIFFALNYYEEADTAFVENETAGEYKIITYPAQLAGIQIRYRLVGIAVLAVLALIILPVAMRKKVKKYTR